MNYLLIGKPNVGKSSIYNILLGTNKNIVHKEEYTTRDWHKGLIKNSNNYIFDSPGVLIDDLKKNNKNSFIILSDLFKKIDIFLYVIDFNHNYNLGDNENIKHLRKHNKNIYIIINKFDNYKKNFENIFTKYGIEKIFFTSCAQNYGFNDLKKNLDIKNKNLNILETDKIHFSLAIFGKPNSGKSTFLNTLLGFKRVLTSSSAGTTSDYIVDTFKYKKKLIKIIDTAGIEKKSIIKKNSINDLSIKKTFSNIPQVDTSMILIDSFEGLNRQDKRIINLVSNKCKSIVLIFNKIDLIKNKSKYKNDITATIAFSLKEIKNIKIFFISAFKKKDINNIIEYLYKYFFIKNYIIPTNKLNLWLKKIVKKNQHPLINKKRINFKYAVQVKNNPLTIKIFCNYSNKLKDNYKRFLINNFNYDFKILNQKTKFIFSSSKNPYL